MKTKSTFRKWYGLYAALLIALLAVLFFYVRGIMVKYENAQPEQYVRQLLQQAAEGKGDLALYMEEACFAPETLSGKIGDPDGRRVRFYQCMQADWTVEAAGAGYDTSHPAYQVTVNGSPVLYVQLEEGESTTKLGIMTLTEWKVSRCVLRKDKAAAGVPETDYEISLPTGLTLLVNNVPLEAFTYGQRPEEGSQALVQIASNGIVDGTVEDMDQYAYVYPYADMPQTVTFLLKDLTFEPTFTAQNDFGESVPVTVESKAGSAYQKVTVEPVYGGAAEAEQMARDASIDPLYMGELWSKFMTNDVGGDARGLYTIRQELRLIKDSDLYQKATRWANAVDITFVSGHRIDSWSDEEVTNYTRYSDDAFSCDVSFNKNMTLKTGAKRVDAFRNRLFFVRIQGQWYLADLFAL